MPRLEGEKSKAPLWLIGAVVAVLAAGAVWYAMRESQENDADRVIDQNVVTTENNTTNSDDNGAENATANSTDANGVSVPTPASPIDASANATTSGTATDAPGAANSTSPGGTMGGPTGTTSGAANSTSPAGTGTATTEAGASPGIQQPGISNAPAGTQPSGAQPSGAQSRVVQPGSPTVTFNQPSSGQAQPSGQTQTTTTGR